MKTLAQCKIEIREKKVYLEYIKRRQAVLKEDSTSLHGEVIYIPHEVKRVERELDELDLLLKLNEAQEDE